MKKVFVITGPTASGKSYLSYRIAVKLKKDYDVETVIVSADSRQVYKEISIATAQPTAIQLKKFRHYFVNELHPDIEFNAGDYGKTARHIIKENLDEHRIPIVTGGSGLYVRSLIHGLFELEHPENGNGLSFKEKQKAIRNKLIRQLDEEGAEKLYKELFKVDPDAAAKMNPSVPRRVIRALEVYYLTGTPISHQHKKTIPVEFDFRQYGINWSREKLYERINNRVDEMIGQGLTEEVRILQMKGYHYKTHNSLNTVGIKEVFDFLEGTINEDRMPELIKQNTRRYAKRQMTWFRKDKEIEWIDVNSENELNSAAEILAGKIKKAYPYLLKARQK